MSQHFDNPNLNKNYIELRVYIKKDADVDEVRNAADKLQDFLTDNLDPSYGGPTFFTQDVTYVIVREKE